MSCQANRDIPSIQECTWGMDDLHSSTPGEDTLPAQERTAELISDVVLIGAAFFVGGLVLTGGALAAGGRTGQVMSTAPAPAQIHHPAPQWPGVS